jgi:hypothetical protein
MQKVTLKQVIQKDKITKIQSQAQSELMEQMQKAKKQV